MEYFSQAGPVASAPINSPHLTWLVYAYGPNGFARERPMGCNPNVMAYPFPSSTRAVNPLLLISLPFPFLHLSITFPNLVFFQNSTHYSRA